MIMKQLIVLICLMMGVNIMAENPQTPYDKKVLGLDETISVHLQEVEFRDDHIINIVASCVPEIKDVDFRTRIIIYECVSSMKIPRR